MKANLSIVYLSITFADKVIFDKKKHKKIKGFFKLRSYLFFSLVITYLLYRNIIALELNIPFADGTFKERTPLDMAEEEHVKVTPKMIKQDSIECYRIQAPSLPDISEAEPIGGNSIFFLETSCKSYIENKIMLQARQACAVESAAINNPDHDVYLLFASPGIVKHGDSESDRIVNALLAYKNVHFYHLDYEKYTKDTPVENLYKERKVEASKYSQSHASDVLRFLTLWKFGGVYLDLDVIVIKPLSVLPPNYAGIQDENLVAAGVLKFSPNGTGHEFAKMCLEDLKQNFSGVIWGNNGPGVITRLLKKLCDEKQPKDMLTKDCQGFKVFPAETFYPIFYPSWRKYFNSKFNNELKNITKNSYVIHVWNKLSARTKVKVNETVPYTMFAKQFCPKVLAECRETF